MYYDTYVYQNIYKTKPHHPPPPYPAVKASYASYDSRRRSYVAWKGVVTGTAMAQPARSPNHVQGRISPPSPNECSEEETLTSTSPAAGEASSFTSGMKRWNCCQGACPAQSLVRAAHGSLGSPLPHLVPAMKY